MKKNFALILTLILVFLCCFALVGCASDGVDGKDGIDGVNGIDGKDGKDGANGTNGVDGVDGLSAYQLYLKYNPDYTGSEEQWLIDLANGTLLARVNNYQVLTHGKNLNAKVTSGSASSINGSMSFSACIAQLDEPIYLPVDETSSWEIKIGGKLATGSGGVQLLTSSKDAIAGRVYLAGNAGKNNVYLGVNIGGVYFNYCWNVPAATINSEHTYVVKYADGLYQLSVDGGNFENFHTFNYDQNGSGSVNVTNAKEVCDDLTSKIRAVTGQTCIAFTSLGAQNFAASSNLAYITATASQSTEYAQMLCHPLYGKTIYHLGSSISYGSATGGVSFADQIREITGSKMVKETVSGTPLAATRNDSYANRWNNFTFSDNPEFLILQLSTNDFTQGVTLGSVTAATQRDNFDKTTTAGALEYIISETQKKSPNTQILIYSCCVKSTWTNSEYSRFANIELKKLQSKWGIGIIDLFSIKPMLPNVMSDDIHPNKQGYALVFTPNMINVMLDYLTAN